MQTREPGALRLAVSEKRAVPGMLAHRLGVVNQILVGSQDVFVGSPSGALMGEQVVEQKRSVTFPHAFL